MLEAEYSTSLYQTIGGTNLPRIWLFGAGTEGQDCVPFNLILVFDSLDLSERAEVILSVFFFFFFFFINFKNCHRSAAWGLNANHNYFAN